MTVHDRLADWLGTLPAERLARIIDEVYVPVLGGHIPGTLQELAQALRRPDLQLMSFESVDLPGLDVLTAAAMQSDHDVGHDEYQYQDIELDESALVAEFDADQHDEVRAVIGQLREKVLLLPGRADRPVLPGLVANLLSGGQYRPRRVGRALGTAFNKPELLRIAMTLDLPETGSKEEIRIKISNYLSDPASMRAILSTAPPEAIEVLEIVLSDPAPVRTQCFEGWGRYTFASADSEHPGIGWLADRALLVPLAPEVAEVPHEVYEALRTDRPRLVLVPPVPPRIAVPAARILDEGQATASAAMSRLAALLGALADRPAGVRKAGGLAVRETRRLAKEISATEDETRFWIDMSLQAGLLGIEAPDVRPTPSRRRRPAPTGQATLLPSPLYDDWLGESPAERLAPVVATWARYEGIVLWWPENVDGSPVALMHPGDRLAPHLRFATMRVLASFPDAEGVDITNPRAFDELTEAIAWHRPWTLTDEFENRVRATLEEARLLGVVAHGALTPLGHAVWAQLGRGSHGRRDAASEIAHLAKALNEQLPALAANGSFQADLTVVVPGIPSPHLSELLGAAADRESEGHAVVWRFSTATVRRALDRGIAPEDLIEQLAAISNGPLPQPLTYMIRDAGRRHGQVRVVRSACCLRSDDESLIMELSGHRSLRKLGLRRIAATVIVSAQPVEQTLAALREAGYAPSLEAETGETVVERAPDRRAPKPSPRRAGKPAPTGLDIARMLLTGVDG